MGKTLHLGTAFLQNAKLKGDFYVQRKLLGVIFKSICFLLMYGLFFLLSISNFILFC